MILNENAELKRTVDELRPLERLNKDKDSINSRLDYIREQEAALADRIKESEAKEE